MISSWLVMVVFVVSFTYVVWYAVDRIRIYFG